MRKKMSTIHMNQQEKNTNWNNIQAWTELPVNSTKIHEDNDILFLTTKEINNMIINTCSIYNILYSKVANKALHSMINYSVAIDLSCYILMVISKVYSQQSFLRKNANVDCKPWNLHYKYKQGSTQISKHAFNRRVRRSFTKPFHFFGSSHLLYVFFSSTVYSLSSLCDEIYKFLEQYWTHFIRLTYDIIVIVLW
jgi:hypothetical protein